MEPQVYIDGKYYQKKDAKISVFDHGLLYGDGVFEGIRCYNGNVFRLKEHIDRLYDSAKTIYLDIPLSKSEMQEVVCETIRKNGLKDAYVRLVVTRGFGDLGLDPRKCPKPTVICIAQSFAPLYGDLYEKGMSIVTVGTRRTSPEAMDVKAKTLNYLNNILAKIQATLANCDEALMLNAHGYVCEGTGDNFFIVKKGVLITPPSYAGVLLGITRATVLETAKKLGMPAKEHNLTLFDAYTADEAFMTGTAAEIIPVVKIDGRQIGEGKPGPVTRRLMEEFRKIREKEGVKL